MHSSIETVASHGDVRSTSEDLLAINRSKVEIARVEEKTLNISVDAEMEGVGRGLGAVVGGGAAMAFTAYIASLFLLPYVKEEINFLSTLLIALLAFTIVALGAVGGARVVKYIENFDAKS
jgi:hypothetical protein